MRSALASRPDQLSDFESQVDMTRIQSIQTLLIVFRQRDRPTPHPANCPFGRPFIVLIVEFWEIGGTKSPLGHNFLDIRKMVDLVF
jgi:hypothetical protein